jgi:hypothetical protein
MGKMVIRLMYVPPGSTTTHTTHLSDVATHYHLGDGEAGGPYVKKFCDEYDDTEVSPTFSYAVFSWSFTQARDLSPLRGIDSACSIDLPRHSPDFVSLDPPPRTPRVGGVGVAIRGSDLLSHSCPARSFTAISTRCTRLTCRLALHTGSANFFVLIGCKLTAVVDSSFSLILISACLWYLQELVCPRLRQTDFNFSHTHLLLRGYHLKSTILL